MNRSAGYQLIVVALFAAPAAPAIGQLPTFSLELQEINSIPIVGQGVSKMNVAPGDLLVAKIFLRDWSPNGEMVAAYQAQLDHSTFQCSDSGTIKPVAYAATTLRGEPNGKNAFIDLTNPRFLHLGLPTVAFTDSHSVLPGYRWMSVLIDKNAPISRQDGTKYYCGTLKLYVSQDAAGTATIDFTPGNQMTGLLNPKGGAIEPVQSEPLTLIVQPDALRCWISASIPKHNAVDARSSTGSSARPWDRIELTLSVDASAVNQNEFEITDGTDSPPKIVRAEPRGKSITLFLNRPITSEAWTTITHAPSGTSTQLGRMHGDVSGDGRCNGSDLDKLVKRINNGQNVATYNSDIDGNGKMTAPDILQLLSLMANNSK